MELAKVAGAGTFQCLFQAACRCRTSPVDCAIWDSDSGLTAKGRAISVILPRALSQTEWAPKEIPLGNQRHQAPLLMAKYKAIRLAAAFQVISMAPILPERFQCHSSPVKT